MIWKDVNIEEVTTYNVIYFEEEFKDTCSKICEVLSIDCFPSIGEMKYWKRTGNSWEKKSINYNTNSIKEAFNKDLLELFSANDSNIVFVSNNSFINGIIHFTNYESAQVYSALYRNLNVFEKSLRDYLIMNGLNDYTYIDYLSNFKIPKEGKKSEERLFKRLEKLREYHGKKRSFENHYLIEIMEFSTSSFHSIETLEQLDLDFLKESIDFKNQKESIMKLINQLRNQVMHHDNISGQTVFTPHNFKEFKIFFELVIVFRSAFEKLSERIDKLNKQKSFTINKKKLELLSKLNDKEISDYFYGLI
jgi:hypothetical protein